MKDINYICDRLKRMLSEKRYQHSLSVCKTAVELSVRYGGDIEKAKIAGLVHDYAKELDKVILLKYVKQFDIMLDDVMKIQMELLHGIVGAEIVSAEFEIYDRDVLNAVRFHTTGRVNMSLLEKIIYLADYIEPTRNFKGVEDLRKVALSDIDKATLMAFDHTIQYVISQRKLLHPDTIHARNSILMEIERFRRE